MNNCIGLRARVAIEYPKSPGRRGGVIRAGTFAVFLREHQVLRLPNGASTTKTEHLLPHFDAAEPATVGEVLAIEGVGIVHSAFVLGQLVADGTVSLGAVRNAARRWSAHRGESEHWTNDPWL